jgi:hypothetical protein
MNINDLKPGDTFHAEGYGMVEFKRWDVYMGQRTAEIALLDHNHERRNPLPQDLERRMKPSSTTPRGLHTLAAELNAEADRLERENVYSAQGITRDWLRDMAVAVLSHASETAPPTDDQLSRLFANYRHYVTDRAPAKDLGELHERQRKAWEGVFGAACTPTSATPAMKEPSEAVLEAADDFLSQGTYLTHPNVRAYLGTENGDDPEAWHSDWRKEFCRVILAAADSADDKRSATPAKCQRCDYPNCFCKDAPPSTGFHKR